MTAHFPGLVQYPYHVNIWELTFLAWYNTHIMYIYDRSLSWLDTITLSCKYMTAHFPGLVQYPYHTNIWPLTFLAWFNTPIIQIYDRSLSWLGSNTPSIQIYDCSLSWVGTIPLSCKYMTAHFPGLVQYPYHVNIWPLTFLAWYNTPIM